MEEKNERSKKMLIEKEVALREKYKLLKEKDEEIYRLKERLNEFEKEKERMRNEIESVKKMNWNDFTK